MWLNPYIQLDNMPTEYLYVNSKQPMKKARALKRGRPASCVRQTQIVDLQVNEVNVVVKCSNRFPFPKLDIYKT